MKNFQSISQTLLRVKVLNSKNQKRDAVKCLAFDFTCISLPIYLPLPISFQTAADKAAPRNGPTINIHNWLSASPPSKSAGPMLRAGLTEVPV